MSRRRLGILVSGRGSNMEALLAAASNPAWPAEAVLVLSNRPDADALGKAALLNVETAVVNHTRYGKDREAFERAMNFELDRAGVELVALAGFMRVLTPWFVRLWAGRLINIHPSLLPKYPGVDTHERALAAGEKVAGCTVHHVTANVDDGPVIGSAEVDVRADDTPETLAARVLKAEHLLYPRCLAAVVRNEETRVVEHVLVDGDEVRILAPR